ncbi:MAG: hypothetical protein RLP02_01010 [Coleofasciculus sp. C2-GNP5-27]|jgi:hypothetical protein|uniref:hypothetical protein n=1 Tax=Coleofasciculus sp. C1-SOL-03 TaxID=3069522 RepID=UPI0032FD606C
MPIQIKVESNDFDERCRCNLCGNIFFPLEVVARAYRDSGEYVSDVCPECLATGAEGISTRIRQRADYLRSLAVELEQLARSDIESPSLAQFNIANQLEKAMR